MNTLFGKDPASDLSSHRKVGEGLKLITDFQELEGFGHYTDTLVAWKMALQGSKVVIKATSSEKVCLFGLFFHCFQSQTQIAVLFYKYNDVTKKFAAWFTDVVDLDEEGACLKHSKRIAALEVLEVLGRDPEMIDYWDDLGVWEKRLGLEEYVLDKVGNHLESVFPDKDLNLGVCLALGSSQHEAA